MFVNIVEFPKIREGKDTEFRQWFADSNRAYADHPGFIRRVLLQPRDGGNYVAVVEHESYETFMAMHTSSTQASCDRGWDHSSKAIPIPHSTMS